MWTKQSRKLDERVAAEVQKALRARAEALGHDLAEGIREYLGQSADAVEGYFSDLRDVLW